MSETIISKRCSKCKQTKPISEFGKNRSRKTGYDYYCKICRCEASHKHTQTDSGKLAKKLRVKCYRKTEQGKAVHLRSVKKHRKTEKGKAAHKKATLKYRQNHPEQFAAHKAVKSAIKSGKLPPISTRKCKCSKQAKQYHHWSYLPEHWLDVEAVCVPCHNKHNQQTLCP